MTNRLKPAEFYTHTHTHTHTGKSCQIIFSTILILGAIGHAGAEPTNTSDSFPLNELMQPDYRYLNSAIYPNTGVYDGDVTVNAMYDWDLFSPTAGNYLPANSTTITTCTSGSFCAGATNVHYENFDQGITACSTLGDNSYTQSATGSASETDCYRNCSGNVTIEHATTVTGNDYYGNGTDTCSATACEGGYHTDNNACGANVLTIHWANSENPNTTCTYGGSITTPATAPTIPGKTFVGWSFVPVFDLSTITGINLTNQGKAYGCINLLSSQQNPNTYGLTAVGTWGTTLADGSTKVRGIARCSNTNDGKTTRGQIGNPGTTTGRYCWCQVTNYLASSETIWQPVVQSSRWVFFSNYNSANTCMDNCSCYCGNNLRNETNFRRAMLGISE